MAFVGVIYGLACYLFFLATFVYAIGFVGDLPVLSKTIDVGATGSLPSALGVDLGLLSLFALQHSIMARRGFKRWWTQFVPESVERSTFVLAATAVLALLLWQWRPIPSPDLWNVTEPAGRAVLQAIFWVGWAILLISTFLINHFELFGLRQVWAGFLGHAIAAPRFRTPLFYRHVRHPIYAGFVLAFWATPRMSPGHFLFAVATTGYILVGIWFEERDLVAQFGNRYRVYCEQVGMLVPRLWPLTRQSTPSHSDGDGV